MDPSDKARTHAVDALLDQRVFTLDAEQHESFVRTLESPPPAGEKLKQLMARKPSWRPVVL
jgi:uncharacterized protein (DUF1778 family)